MQFWGAFEATRLCAEKLANMGLTIEVTTDPDRVGWSVKESGKPYLTPWLDPGRNDFTSDNFFWLIALHEGAPVIVGGGRLDSLGTEADMVMHRMFSRGYGADAVLSASPAVKWNMQGSACYLGDLYAKAATGMARKATRYYLGIANYLASHHFRADVVYSFMREADVRRGSADTNGLDARIYDPVVWGDLPDARDPSEIIVYRPRSHNSAYFARLTRELASSAPVLSPAPDHRSPAAQA